MISILHGVRDVCAAVCIMWCVVYACMDCLLLLLRVFCAMCNVHIRTHSAAREGPTGDCTYTILPITYTQANIAYSRAYCDCLAANERNTIFVVDDV